MVTGKTMSAVMPQIIIAPQPPISTTDQPSDPSRNPGFARQITNPSYQRSVFRSWRSSTIASATLYLPVVWIGGTQLFGPRSESNTCRRWFQLRRSHVPGEMRRTMTPMSKPPITIKCECGETKSVAYGQRWVCDSCHRAWNTQQIPPEEY